MKLLYQLLGFLVLIILTSCAEEWSPAEPPDVAELQAVSGEPTGSVQGLSTEDVVTRVTEDLPTIAALCTNPPGGACALGDDCSGCWISKRLRQVFDGLLLEKFDFGRADFLNDDRIIGDGVFAYTGICGDPMGKPDLKNGELVLNGTFTNTGIGPALWGRFSNCQVVLDNDTRITINGDVLLYAPTPTFGEMGQLSMSGSEEVLQDLVLDLEGTITAGEVEAPISTILRFVDDFNVLLPSPDRPGLVIARDHVRLIGRDGTLRCDYGLTSCEEAPQ